MLPELSIKLLEHQMAGEAITGIDVGVGEGGFTYAFHGADGAAPAADAAVLEAAS
ncbi:MAG: hypothetical protein IT546_07440 [Caulobacteraceae bacterium]|nr:hypothetical protein [Caulobacteraceae bacterium]